MNNLLLKFIRIFHHEISHSLTIKILKLKFSSRIYDDDPSLHQHLFGLDFRNPIGLAAGFDKNVEVVESLLNLGFGFVEAGTVTPKPQFGNKKPRVFRLLEDQAIINHLGFNNYGSKYAEKKLIKLNLNNLSKGIVGINIGLLFQIVDDLIDYKGDSAIVGKPTKCDEKKGKATLVNLLGYEETINFAKNLKKKINHQIKKYGTKANDLLDSVQFILERKF